MNTILHPPFQHLHLQFAKSIRCSRSSSSLSLPKTLIRPCTTTTPTITLPLTAPFIRRFSSSTMSTTNQEFLVILNDHPNSLAKRMSVRPSHLSALKPFVEAGQVVFGGAMLTKHPAEGEAPELTGSVMLYKAESADKVWEMIKGDIYATSGVWDMESAKVVPFKSAVRMGM